MLSSKQKNDLIRNFGIAFPKEFESHEGTFQKFTSSTIVKQQIKRNAQLQQSILSSYSSWPKLTHSVRLQYPTTPSFFHSVNSPAYLKSVWNKMPGLLDHVKMLNYSRRRRSNSALLVEDIPVETNLLRSSSSSNNLKNAMPPIKIKTHLRVVNLVDVNTVNETFKVHLVVFMEWEAPSTESPEVLADGLDRMDVDWEPEWRPSFEIVGAMEMTTENELYTFKNQSGTWCISWRCDIKAEITDSMDLEEFPFDVEDLTITYRLRHSTRGAVIVPFCEEMPEKDDDDLTTTNSCGMQTGKKIKTPRHNDRGKRQFEVPAAIAYKNAASGLQVVDLSHANVTLPDYILFKPAPYCWVVEDVRYFGRKCSTVTVQLNFERSALYYMVNVASIELCLVCVNLGAWALPQKRGGRLVFDLILILTAISFRGILASKLPEIGYLTIIDYYNFICFSFKIAAFALHVAQVWRPKVLASPDVDELAAMIYIGAVFVVHIVFSVYVLKKRRIREAEVLEQCEVARQGNIKLHHSSRTIVDTSTTLTTETDEAKVQDAEREISSSLETGTIESVPPNMF